MRLVSRVHVNCIHILGPDLEHAWLVALEIGSPLTKFDAVEDYDMG